MASDLPIAKLMAAGGEVAFPSEVLSPGNRVVTAH